MPVSVSVGRKRKCSRGVTFHRRQPSSPPSSNNPSTLFWSAGDIHIINRHRLSGGRGPFPWDEWLGDFGTPRHIGLSRHGRRCQPKVPFGKIALFLCICFRNFLLFLVFFISSLFLFSFRLLVCSIGAHHRLLITLLSQSVIVSSIVWNVFAQQCHSLTVWYLTQLYLFTFSLFLLPQSRLQLTSAQLDVRERAVLALILSKSLSVIFWRFILRIKFCFLPGVFSFLKLGLSLSFCFWKFFCSGVCLFFSIFLVFSSFFLFLPLPRSLLASRLFDEETLFFFSLFIVLLLQAHREEKPVYVKRREEQEWKRLVKERFKKSRPVRFEHRRHDFHES